MIELLVVCHWHGTGLFDIGIAVLRVMVERVFGLRRVRIFLICFDTVYHAFRGSDKLSLIGLLLEFLENLYGLKRVGTCLMLGALTFDFQGVGHSVESSSEIVNSSGDDLDVLDLWEVDLEEFEEPGSLERQIVAGKKSGEVAEIIAPMENDPGKFIGADQS